MNQLSSRNNRLKFIETSRELPMILEKSIEDYTSNEWKQQIRKMSTCNQPAGSRFTRTLTDSIHMPKKLPSQALNCTTFTMLYRCPVARIEWWLLLHPLQCHFEPIQSSSQGVWKWCFEPQQSPSRSFWKWCKRWLTICIYHYIR